MQSMPCLTRGKLVIIVLPLNTISSKQEVNIRKIPSINPIFIYKKIIKPAIYSKIRKGVYTYILSSPELFSNARFTNIETDSFFRRYISLVVVDKVYLIYN